LVCGKEYKVGKSRKDRAKFCSTACYYASRKKPPKPKEDKYTKLVKYCRIGSSNMIEYCKQCGKVFRHEKKRVFCSSECSQQYQIDHAVRHPRNRNRRKSKSTEFSRNRLLAFARDKYRCQYCGVGLNGKTSYGESVTLHADHIRPKVDGGSDELNNLVTACQECNYAKYTLKILPSFKQKDEKEDLQLPLLPMVH
jgi:5-methylcytosine-specific restriction endonuclease McrA